MKIGVMLYSEYKIRPADGLSASYSNLYCLTVKFRSKLLLYFLSAFNDFKLQIYKASLSE